ncbi:MAG: DUF2283 domain-containing protein [Acidobacteria bacterium]|nr:DUF2283 domain-containing protein [Acidobacteriota bacterium]
MKNTYLEVTFRKGRPFAAYLYLPRAAGVKSARTKQVAPGILVDFSSADDAIGIEITAPIQVTAQQVNDALKAIGLATVSPEDLAPLRAA